VNFLSTGVDALTLTETPTGDVKITPALVVSSVLYVLDGKMTTKLNVPDARPSTLNVPTTLTVMLCQLELALKDDAAVAP
jgi:hypothetical protein